MVTDSDSKYIHPYETFFDKDGNVNVHVSMIIFYGDIIFLSSREKRSSFFHLGKKEAANHRLGLALFKKLEYSVVSVVFLIFQII